MKSNRINAGWLMLLALLTLNLQPSTVHAQGAAFTYQGRLFIGDVPANGLYDLQFTNYNAATGGSALGGFDTNALPVTNGLFTVTLDFGAVFDGTPCWLEISERTNGAAAFATLAPRQLLAAAPYATYAASAGTAGTVAGLTILQNASGAPNVIAGSPVNWVANGVVGATIGGGGATNYNGGYFFTNSVSADFGTIGGGYVNTIQTGAKMSTIGGGVQNTIYDIEATIGGGGVNMIQPGASEATIGGGGNNVIYASLATIGGGFYNRIQANATEATIGGGDNNTIQTNANEATIGGGASNVIQPNAQYATIPGGYQNSATNFAFAAGNHAQAIHTGAFVWADNSGGFFSSTANNQFAVRANGGVQFVTSGAGLTVDGTVTADKVSTASLKVDTADGNSGTLSPGITFGAGATGEGIASKRATGIGWAGLDFYTASTLRVRINNNGNVGIGTTNNTYLLAVGSSASPAYCNGSTWQNGSDRNSKEAFTAINPRTVLEKVSALPITEWKYKVEADGTEHIGPMAQDFHAAFGLNGPDDKHIATVDAEGVALAAIQGLNQKLEENNATLEKALTARDAQIQALQSRLEALEKRLAR